MLKLLKMEGKIYFWLKCMNDIGDLKINSYKLYNILYFILKGFKYYVYCFLVVYVNSILKKNLELFYVRVCNVFVGYIFLRWIERVVILII